MGLGFGKAQYRESGNLSKAITPTLSSWSKMALILALFYLGPHSLSPAFQLPNSISQPSTFALDLLLCLGGLWFTNPIYLLQEGLLRSRPQNELWSKAGEKLPHATRFRSIGHSPTTPIPPVSSPTPTTTRKRKVTFDGVGFPMCMADPSNQQSRGLHLGITRGPFTSLRNCTENIMHMLYEDSWANVTKI